MKNDVSWKAHALSSEYWTVGLNPCKSLVLVRWAELQVIGQQALDMNSHLTKFYPKLPNN